MDTRAHLANLLDDTINVIEPVVRPIHEDLVADIHRDNNLVEAIGVFDREPNLLFVFLLGFVRIEPDALHHPDRQVVFLDDLEDIQ